MEENIDTAEMKVLLSSSPNGSDKKEEEDSSEISNSIALKPQISQ